MEGKENFMIHKQNKDVLEGKNYKTKYAVMYLIFVLLQECGKYRYRNSEEAFRFVFKIFGHVKKLRHSPLGDWQIAD